MTKNNRGETAAYIPPRDNSRENPNKREGNLLETPTDQLRKKRPDQTNPSENGFFLTIQQARDISSKIRDLDTELDILAKEIDQNDADTVDITSLENKKTELDELYKQLENIQDEYITMIEKQSTATEEDAEAMHGFLSAIETRNTQQIDIIPTKIEKIKSKWDAYHEQYGPMIEAEETPTSDEQIEELAQKKYELKQITQEFRKAVAARRPMTEIMPLDRIVTDLNKTIETLKKAIPQQERDSIRKKVNQRVEEIKQETQERETREQVDNALRAILPLLEQKALIQSEKIANTDIRRKLDQISTTSKLDTQINAVVGTLPADATKKIKTELVWISKELAREATERRKEEATTAEISRDFTPPWQRPGSRQEMMGSTRETRSPKRAEKEKSELQERLTQTRNELIDMKRNVSRFTFGGLWGAFKNKLRFTSTETGTEPSKDEANLPPDQVTNGLAIADPKPENLTKIIEKLAKSSKPYDQADAKMLREYEDKLSELIKLSIQL